MGLAVDEEDSPSPPPPPPQGFLGHPGWPPLPLRLPPPPHHLNIPTLPPPMPPMQLQHPQQPQILPSTTIRAKRQFDVASLLASESKEDSVDNNNEENDNTEETTSWRSVSPQPLPQPPLMPHQYLARYYQLVQQQHQQQHSAAAAAALAAAAAAAAAASMTSGKEKSVTTSPRGSPISPANNIFANHEVNRTC